MPSAIEQRVGPAAFLMDNSRPFTQIVKPRGRRLARESLNAAESGILGSGQLRDSSAALTDILV